MKPTYPGLLGKKMKLRTERIISLTEDERDLWLKSEIQATEERLGLLFNHYQVDPSNPLALAFRLAQAHVPGFQYERAARGPKSPWHDYARAFLALDVDALQGTNPSLSILECCARLARKEPWRNMLRGPGRAGTGKSGDALRKHYEKADRLIVERLRDHPNLARLRDSLLGQD